MGKAWHLTAWGIVNVLFVVKYGVRIHPLLPWAGAAFVMAGPFAIPGAARFLESKRVAFLLPWLFLGALLAVSAACFFRIPTGALRFDRFDMIDVFWENVRAGIDPYTPRVPGISCVPSQFPSYFLFALPFRLLGDIGWIAVVSIASIGWILWRRSESAYSPISRGPCTEPLSSLSDQ